MPPTTAAAPLYPDPSRTRRVWPRPFGGGQRTVGRAVLNVVRSPEGCPTGEWATLAAREILERRLLIRTLRGGCGVASVPAATAEAARAGVPSVVMAAVENLRFEPGYSGYRPVGRLRVLVVRDGQLTFDRALDLGARPLPRADVGRATYDLTAQGFMQLATELAAALRE
jgi:hypothetical protein